MLRLFERDLQGDQAQIVCNECGAVVRVVPGADRLRTLDQMELTLDVCAEKCPHSSAINLLPRFSRVMIFTCENCAVRRSDDPDSERFFGKE